MEFPEANKASALKFLEAFCSKESPLGDDDQPPVRAPWPKLEDGEMEAECLDMARRYLSGKNCPGFLSYHIAAEVCRRLKTSSLDHLRPPNKPSPSEEGSEKELEGQSPLMLDSVLLGRELVCTLHTVCKEWCAELPSLTLPVDKVELSMFGIKNTRRKMEDRYAICLDLNSLYGLQDMPSQTYFAVFDGHVGVEAAAYASTHVLTNIVRHPSFHQDLVTAIKEGIAKTDQVFCRKGMRSGTTAVLALTRGDKLYIGWLGDSQALLVRRGEPLQLVNPHKPEREDEQKRIEEAGGVVIWVGAWRVNGNLSVSRAIGDAKDKKFVIGEADVSTFELDGSEDYLVVACDGVWDVLSGEEVVTCVKTHLSTPSGSKQTVAKALVDFAKSEGSGDNMTVIVVYFKGFTGDTPLPDKSCDAQSADNKESCDPTAEEQSTKDSGSG